MFSRRPSGGADFILLFTSGNLFDNDRPAGCGGGVVDGRGGERTAEREREDRRTRTTFDTIRTKKRVDALSTLLVSFQLRRPSYSSKFPRFSLILRPIVRAFQPPFFVRFSLPVRRLWRANSVFLAFVTSNVRIGNTYARRHQVVGSKAATVTGANHARET